MSSTPADPAANLALSIFGLVETDPHAARFIRVNERFCEFLGRTERELLELAPFDIVHPDDRGQFERAASALLSGAEERVHGERRYLKADGTFVWLQTVSTAIRDRDGRVVSLAAVAQDVTARRNMEDQLSFHAHLLDSVEQAAIATDPQGVVLYWNRFAERLYGWTRAEAIGRKITDLTVAPDGLDSAEQIMAKVSAGESWSGEFVVRSKSGRVFPVHITDLPVLGKDGKLEAILGISTDLSEHYRVLESLRDADRRKDEFLATLAHELRNPLAPIRNATQIMLVADNDRAVLSTARRMIERQLQQMVRLIDDLLDVSRITRGRLELRFERITLSAVIELAVETSRPLIEGKQHRLRISLPPEPVYISGDITRLAQIFSNLLNNSAKYSEAGGQIDVGAEVLANEVAVTVADSGIGIDAESLGRVFDMFMQAGSAGAHPQEGLGIGLTLVKRLVELHGGRVEAQSEGLGKGSRFVVYLSIAEAPAARDPHADARPFSALPETAVLRVLVADDNRDSASSLAMMLELDGHEVRTAYDGVEAVEVAESFKPDLALLDIGMPRLDGYATARELRSKSWAEGLTLVALTGWGQDEDRRRTREAGFDLHLVKPVEPSYLHRLLQEQAGRLSARDRPPMTAAT